MDKILRSVEDAPEPTFIELIKELDDADFGVLKRYDRFINLPTEHNFNRISKDSEHLYHAFGHYLRKVVHGDVTNDPERVSMTATVINDIAQKHHWTLAEYETARIKFELPDWDDIQTTLTTDLGDALSDSLHAFSDLAIDRVVSIIDGEKTVLIKISGELKQRRIDMGRQALSTTKDVLKVSAGTIIGIATWNRLFKKD